MNKCKEPKLSLCDIKTTWNDEWMNSEYNQMEVHVEKEYAKIDECIFKAITFDSCQFIKGDIMDVIFENCDCSNMIFSGSSFHRVIFKNCRMIGCDFTDASLNDVQFIRSRQTFINFSGSKLKNARFIECDCRESRFVETSFKNCDIDQCNFTQAEFIHTSLKNLDLSTSDIAGITLTPESIPGVIVNSYQAIDLSKLLGIIIKDE